MKKYFVLIIVVVMVMSCKEEESFPECLLETPQPIMEMDGDKIIFIWNTVEGAVFYDGRYKNAKVTKENFIMAEPLNDTSAVVEYFYPSTLYRFYVHASNMETHEASCPGEGLEFTTPCVPFDKLDILNITSTQATISWYDGIFDFHTDKENISDIESFTLNVRPKGTLEIMFYGTDEHYYDLEELEPGTVYEVQLVYTCGTNDEIYSSEWKTFQTKA